MKMKKGKRRSNNHSIALAVSGIGVFKGRCYVCGYCGHKSNHCPLRNRNTQNGQNLHLHMKIATQVQQVIIQEIVTTTTFLPEDQDFKDFAITAESGDIGEKIPGF